MNILVALTLSHRLKFCVAGVAAFLTVGAIANPITLVPGTINMFRDSRAANDVGDTSGERFQFGASISGGSLGTELSATYPYPQLPGPGTITTGQSPCAPLSVNANFCARTATFNANRLQPWTLNFFNGTDTLHVAGPSLVGTENPVPFPVNVTLSNGPTATQPTISWTVPSTFTPEAFRITVYNRDNFLANGAADIIHSVPVSPSATSYTLPATLSSGQSLTLGGNYTIALQLIDTRTSAEFTGNNAEILRRSLSYFDFTPTGNLPVDVFLPSIVNGVYNFSITNVGTTSVTFIDPLIAIGYDYATTAGDPNFASVLLPTGIGDNLYDLFLWDAISSAFIDSNINLTGGSQYFFGGLGVNRFSIRGIETSAGLDPNNGNAFVTGLTFVSTGNFTGTMTPITLDVPAPSIPEPATFALLGLALAGLGFSRRKQ